MSAIKSQKAAEDRQTKENITTLVGIILYYIFHGEFASDWNSAFVQDSFVEQRTRTGEHQ